MQVSSNCVKKCMTVKWVGRAKCGPCLCYCHTVVGGITWSIETPPVLWECHLIHGCCSHALELLRVTFMTAVLL